MPTTTRKTGEKGRSAKLLRAVWPLNSWEGKTMCGQPGAVQQQSYGQDGSRLWWIWMTSSGIRCTGWRIEAINYWGKRAVQCSAIIAASSRRKTPHHSLFSTTTGAEGSTLYVYKGFHLHFSFWGSLGSCFQKGWRWKVSVLLQRCISRSCLHASTWLQMEQETWPPVSFLLFPGANCFEGAMAAVYAQNFSHRTLPGRRSLYLPLYTRILLIGGAMTLTVTVVMMTICRLTMVAPGVLICR